MCLRKLIDGLATGRGVDPSTPELRRASITIEPPLGASEEERKAALQALFASTNAGYRSEGPYGSRDDLYDRDGEHVSPSGRGINHSFPQRTIGEIVESEWRMVITAPDRYGSFYANAFNVGVLLQHGITGVPASRDIFAMFASQVKKHYLLALFSFVRLHQIQGLMNLRQTLEAGAGAAYAVAHNDPADFADADPNGILDPTAELTSRRYRWLDQHYPAGSKSLKELKEAINQFGSHANIVQTGNNFRPELGWFETSFFDREDDYFVKTDLWRSANVGLSVIDLWFGINLNEKALVFSDDFQQRLSQLAVEHNRLRDEMMATERYQSAQRIQSKSADKTS